MKRLSLSRVLPVLQILLLLLDVGCVKPDRLPIFDTQLRYPEASAPEKSLWEPPEPPPQFLADENLVTTASGSLELTVEQAIQLALRNNRDLRIVQVNPVIAGTFEAFERGVFDPVMIGDLTVSREKSREVSQSGVWSTEVEDGHTAAVGLSQKLPTGTLVDVSAAQTGSDPDSTPPEQKARIGLSVTQSLLRGFGPMVNLVSIRQAELGTAISNHELRGFTEALLANTEIAYWDYVLAGQTIEIYERSLAIAQQQLDEILQRIEVGTLPRIEAAAAHAEVARREQALIDVRSQLEENRLRLLRLINLGQGRGFDQRIMATSEAGFDPSPISDLADRLLLAEKLRPDLSEARLRLRQNRLSTTITRNGLLPQLDLFITLGKTGYGGAFADSLDEVDGDHYDVRGGIRLSHYLNNRQAVARDLAARASWRQASEAVENLRQLIDLDVRLAVNEFERSRQQIAATRATRLLQEETLQAENERFDVGASTSLLVAQAQRDFLASSIDEVEAIINCRKALVRLYLAEGSLQERRGVRLADSALGGHQ
jgi:outer membrane protein TolC